MTEPGEETARVVPQEVLVLLEERRKVHQWLAKLGELEEEASQVVYDKVRRDYQGRLAEVNSRLAAHRSDIEASVARHRERASGLQKEREAKAAELEESEIRHRVGEYDEGEWHRRREEHQGALHGMDARLEEENHALADLERVLSEMAAAQEETGRRTGVAGRGERMEAAEREGLGEEEAQEVDRAGEEKPPVARRRSEAPAEAEKRREEAPRAPAVEEGPALAAAAPPETEAEEGDRESEFLDELEFLESLSLDESDRFDAVSLALEEEEEEAGGREGKAR